MSNSITSGVDIHSLFAQYTAKQNTAPPAQAHARQPITDTASVSLSVPTSVLTTVAANGLVPPVTYEFGASAASILQAEQTNTFAPFTPKDALPFDNQTTPFDKLPDKPWPDPMSRELLKQVSEAFVMLTAGSSSRAYHIASGDMMSKEGFRQHCASHVGEVVLEWKGTVQSDPKAKVTPIGGVEIVRKEERKPLGDYWWDHDLPDFGRRAVRRVIMEPTSQTAEQDARSNPEVLNLWHAYKKEMIEPIEGVTLEDPRIAIFLKQMRRYAGCASDCDETVMFFLAGYAWIYKYPDVKLPWYTLMYSEFQGTGKSKLFKLFKRVLGEGLVSSCTGEDLNEKFTELTDHKRMVFVHEMPQAASRSATGYERFKNRTTEEYVASRQMRTGSKQIRNFTHYVISTNNMDCLPLAHRDRRALSMVDHGQPLSMAERNAWANFCDGDEGPALVAGLLANWKHPTDYSPYADVPQTAGALEMQMESRSPLVALLAECFAECKGVFAKDIGRPADICAELGTAYPTATRRMDLSPSSVGRAARKAGAIQIGNPTNAGSRALCWRKQTYWIDVPAKARSAYIETGTPPDDYPKTEVTDHD
jgi:hypothetical protein